MLQFLFNQQVTNLHEPRADQTILQFLREQQYRMGTKEGCASGDCGACTVVIAEEQNDQIQYRSVNSCITLLSALQGQCLITVEQLAQGEKLHPVQQAMVDNHASQCGFCTPGFVMSLFALWKHDPAPKREAIEHALGGNLCRCTGYRPIVAAGLALADYPTEDQFDERELLEALRGMKHPSSTKPLPNKEDTPHSSPDKRVEALRILSGPEVFHPETAEEVATLLQQYPTARLVGGSTDLALEITQQLKSIPQMIHLAGVAELCQIHVTESGVEIGAACPYSACLPVLREHFPAFADLMLRLGSTQIRNQGTFGGNLGTASPIGDTPPALLALNATIIVQSVQGQRSIAIDDFFLGYRKTALQVGEFIRAVQIPRLQTGEQLFIAKISKRKDDDISAVCAAWCWREEQGRIVAIRSGYGGMAAIPARAKQTEQALLGQEWNEASLQHAQQALLRDFQPLSDVRASSEYRLQVAQGLLRRMGEEPSPSSPFSLTGGEEHSKEPSPPHDSASRHVQGTALYVDDIPIPANTLHAMVGMSTIAAGEVLSMDLSAVLAAAEVQAVLTLADVPGHTDIGAVFAGDPLLCDGQVLFYGQPLFVVAANSYQSARVAARLAKVAYKTDMPLLDVKQALAERRFVRPSHTMQRGEVATALNAAPIQLSAEQMIGGQEHFYLEGQVSLAIPAEEGGVHVHTSSQHPSEVQKLVAEVLALPLHKVTVEVRRMGGGFGGKETQAAQWACLAALLAVKTQRAVKLRLPRADDMALTGKRHPFYNRYQIGCDAEGRILAADLQVVGDCGYSPDLSDAIVDRAMFHADNAYYLPTARIIGERCFTNTVSHTAFRGFGGPQGMMLIERAMDDIARRVGKDPLTVRKLNLYQDGQTTCYGQTIEHFVLPTLIEELEQTSQYWQRREAIRAFNQHSTVYKKGLALTPVKFGISFTVQHLNQAGALLHVYTDGSIHLNHGGTEMGQGLHTKVAQVVAREFGVDVEQVLVSSTRTDKVPNTSPTAASSGADLNGKAAQQAAQTIKARLSEFLAEKQAVPVESIVFAHNRVVFAGGECSFAELAQQAYLARVSLSATGYYKTPLIHYDRSKAQGRPFFYFAMGAAVSEVLVDTLTGEYQVTQVDILHDVGESLNPALDIGQIEGGFIQGMGWLTAEELVWDKNGRLLSNNPATYKIPAISDTPPIFNVALLQNHPNGVPTIYHSKAVGEPPFMLAISVWSALRDALSSLSDYRLSPNLDTPATPERVLKAVLGVKTSHD